MDLVGGGHGLPRQLRFVKFVCQNERIGSLRWSACQVCPPKSANEWICLSSAIDVSLVMDVSILLSAGGSKTGTSLMNEIIGDNCN